MEKKRALPRKFMTDLAKGSVVHEGGRLALDGLSVKMDLLTGIPVFTVGEVLAKHAVRRARGIEKIRYVDPHWGLVEMDVKTRHLPDGRRAVVRPMPGTAFVVKPTREYKWVSAVRQHEQELLKRRRELIARQRAAQASYVKRLRQGG